jgi:hypothetical protein
MAIALQAIQTTRFLLGATVGACFNTCKPAAAPLDGGTGNTAYSDPMAYVFAETKGIQEDAFESGCRSLSVLLRCPWKI